MEDLSSKYLTTPYVRNDPLINLCHAVISGSYLLDGTHPPKNRPVVVTDYKQKGDLLIWDMWEKGME